MKEISTQKRSKLGNSSSSKLDLNLIQKQQKELQSEFDKQHKSSKPVQFYSNLSMLPKTKQVKTVTYQRIQELQQRMDVAIDRNEDKSLKVQFDKLQASSRFKMNYPKSIEEIGTKSNAVTSQNKMEFIRNKFRNDINKITTNLIQEVENIDHDDGNQIRQRFGMERFNMAADQAQKKIDANLEELDGIKELKRIDKAMQN